MVCRRISARRLLHTASRPVLLALLSVAGLALLAQDSLLDDMNRRVPVLLDGAQTRSDTQHTPRLKAPRVVEVAGEVAVTVSVPLLGDEKHYIRRLALIDENSLVKLKYLATFAPAVRPVQVTALIKMAKTSQIKAIAECSLHGTWLGVSESILVGMGGCGAGQEPNRKLTGEVLRVRFQDQGDRVETNLLFRHPMLSGYVMTDAGRIVKSYEPFFLKLARVSHKNQVLAQFEVGPGLSENPRIGVLLPRLSGEPLKAEAVNSTQQQFTLLARMQ